MWLTIRAEMASNQVVVRFCPSREEDLLSDHVFRLFNRSVTITGNEQFLAVVILVIAATAWAVQQFRRRRAVVVQRSAVSDQVVYELSRVADALERIANRPADQYITAASDRQTEEPGRISLSMFGR